MAPVTQSLNRMASFPQVEQLPEGHVGRAWWNGTLPGLPDGRLWPVPTSQVDWEERLNQGAEHIDRALLKERVLSQYRDAGMAVPARAFDLDGERVRTVTTGHQLCIAGGPAFTCYKILTAIHLAHWLEDRFGTPVVPVFWLASEDHDFEEIRSVWDGAGWMDWNPPFPTGGPVGRMASDGLKSVLSAWGDRLGFTQEQRWAESAGDAPNLATAMRKWIHAMFGPDRVVVLDGDDGPLKAVFAACMAREVQEGMAFAEVGRCNAVLEQGGFTPQVHVRTCNLFHLTGGGRHRIERGDEGWRSLGGVQWPTEEALLSDIHGQPEAFSPNALLRPVYQSMVLPDVAVVGGWAEVSYWLQLPLVYNRLSIPQPALVPRDGALVLPPKWSALMDRCGIGEGALGASLQDWQAAIVDGAELPDLERWRSSLHHEAAAAETAHAALDPSLVSSVRAALAKMEGLLDKLGQQGERAIRRREQVAMDRMAKLHAWVQPNGKLQERVAGMSLLSAEWERTGSDGGSLTHALDTAFKKGHGEGVWRPLMHVIRPPMG